MGATATTEISLAEYGKRYVQLYQDSANLFNELIEQGGSLAVRVEQAALVGGLAVHSKLDRKVYEEHHIYDDQGRRQWQDVFNASTKLDSRFEPGSIYERRSLTVILPDRGEENSQYVSRPALYINDSTVNNEMTFLQVHFSGGGGTKVRGAYGEGPDAITWLDVKESSTGLKVVPRIQEAKWMVKNLINTPERVDIQFKPAEALVNALKGIVGAFEER